MTAAFEVRGVTLAIDGHPVLTGVDLVVEAGEMVALLGPSGSGKTTLLSVIAGFVPPDAGEVVIDGVVVSGPGAQVPPERRSIGFVFQSYALWPHLSAAETVAFPLRSVAVPIAEARRRAMDILDALGVAHLAERRPAELSGGEQQRVGLARALARDGGLYLLDEPTAHLDASTRTTASRLIAEQRARRHAAALYATHDAAEAMGAADRVAVMRSGRIVQVGTPQQVYQEPVDKWVAALTGPVSVVDYWPGVGRVAIRPEWVTLGGEHEGTVIEVRFRGPHTDVHLDTGFGEITMRVVDDPPRHGDRVPWSASRVWPVG